jgi:hypothetical protein
MSIRITQHKCAAVKLAMIVQMPDEDLLDDFVERRAEAQLAAVQEFALTPQQVTEALLCSVITNACPYKVLQKPKRYMRRYMRKPADMKVRTYVHSLMKLNHEEIPLLPRVVPIQDFQSHYFAGTEPTRVL